MNQIILIFTLTCLIATAVSDQKGYHKRAHLHDNFNLEWKQLDDDKMQFRATARTRGWLAVGFSPTGGMKGADIIFAWIDTGGVGRISDRFSTEFALPIEDEQQDYELLSAKKNGTHLTVEFRRPLETCDSNDWRITSDTARVLWAFDDRLVENQESGTPDFQKHLYANRGVQSLHLLEDVGSDHAEVPPSDSYGPDTRTLEFRMDNVHIPEDHHTLYMCRVFKAPNWGKQHMIRHDTVITPGHEKYMHHIMIYVCPTPMEEWVDVQEPCFDRSQKVFTPMYSCTAGKFLMIYNKGGAKIYTYGDDEGAPVFEEGTEMYFLLEAHYDNAAYDKGRIDNSGIRLYLTDNFRPVEVGQLMFGMRVGALYQTVPPRQTNFVNYGICSNECSRKLPEDGITVRSGMLHKHSSGALRLRHFRNAIELPTLFEDNHYDFNYQLWRFKNPPVKIMPGDELVAECEYDSSDKVRYGGFSTSQEMCIISIEYYPKTDNLDGCMSYPDTNAIFKLLGAQETYPQEQLLLTKAGRNVSAADWLERDVDWSVLDDDEIVSQLQTANRDIGHTVACIQTRKHIDQGDKFVSAGLAQQADDDLMSYFGYPKFEKPYNPDVCAAAVSCGMGLGAAFTSILGLIVVYLFE